MRKFFLILILVIVSTLFLSACASKSSNGPTKAVEDYLNALVAKNSDRLTTISCKDWENEALLELDSFQAVTTKLDGMSCTQTGTDGELILRRTDKSGCVFLDGNDCTIYEFRPKTCEGFPHLLKGMGSIQHKMWAYVDRATYCPIVYNWMEQVKDLTNFKK